MTKKMMLTCFLLIIGLAATHIAAAQTVSAPPASSNSALPPPAPSAKASVPSLTVVQIIEKNLESRGGMKAWEAVQSMSESGKLDASSRAHVQLPFRLEMKRPRKSRLEIDFNGQTAVQSYDGANGWTLRPYLGRTDPQPYTADELKKAAEQQELDGPLFDYAAKGTKAELIGVEQVEGHDAYKIKLTLNVGTVRHIWIDAQSFLDLKIEGTPRVLNGRPHDVMVYYRDYRDVHGLKIPFTLETAVKDVVGTQKMVIEFVKLNPELDDADFGRPQSLPANALLQRPVPITKSVSPNRRVPPIKR